MVRVTKAFLTRDVAEWPELINAGIFLSLQKREKMLV
jgi:hypothetical protein